MDDMAKKEIDEMYEDIMKVIVGSTLYGYPVTDNNIKMLVVSAYFYGMYGDVDTEVEEDVNI